MVLTYVLCILYVTVYMLFLQFVILCLKCNIYHRIIHSVCDKF